VAGRDYVDGSPEEVRQETLQPVEAIEGLEPPNVGIEVDHEVVVTRGARVPALTQSIRSRRTRGSTPPWRR